MKDLNIETVKESISFQDDDDLTIEELSDLDHDGTKSETGDNANAL